MLSPPHDHVRAHVSLCLEVGPGYSPGSRVEVRLEKNSLLCLETLPCQSLDEYPGPARAWCMRPPFGLLNSVLNCYSSAKAPLIGTHPEPIKAVYFSNGCGQDRVRAARRQPVAVRSGPAQEQRCTNQMA